MMTGLTILGALVALAWSILTVRIFKGIKAFSFVKPCPWDGSKQADVTVDAVVPAHNEETEIAATVRDLLRQDFPGMTLTVVNDQSTDRTGEILDALATQTPRLQVIHGVSRPPGWVGKTWALHQGVQRSAADWIFFVDADMRLDPAALTTALDEAARTESDLVSFLPRGNCETIWQTTLALTLGQMLAQLYPLGAVNDPARAEALAAGGFILVKREAYLKVGGHEAVRSEIVDDILLARKLKASGGRILCRTAPSLASTHMYGSLGQIWRGLQKNAYAGMEYQLHKYVVGVIAGILLAWAPWVALIAGLVAQNLGASLVGLWGILAQVAVSYPLTVFMGVSPLGGLTLPLGITLYIGIATSSVRDYYSGHILWKGQMLRRSEIFAASGTDQSPPP